MSEGPIQIKIIAKTLYDFREFVMRNAVKWELGANHHNPMWSRVAETLDAVGMNSGELIPADKVLVWHCPQCDDRIAADVSYCVACACGVAEHQDGLFGADRDPTARARAVERGQASYREGPNYVEYRCVVCCTKLVHRYEKCPTCSRAANIGPAAVIVPTCYICGCTDLDCSGCIQATGKPCSWVHGPGEQPLCSACQEQDLPALIAAVDAMEDGPFGALAPASYPCDYPNCECDDQFGPCQHMIAAGYTHFPQPVQPDDLDPAEAAALNGSTGELTRAEIRAGAEAPVIITVTPTMIDGKRADEGDGCTYGSDTCKICKDGDLPKPVRVHGI